MRVSFLRKFFYRPERSAILVSGLSLLLFCATCHQNPPSHTLTIAAASSLRPPLDAIAAAYRGETGTDIQLVYGSSGKLTAQITAGAPYHLYLSASRTYTDELERRGLAAKTALPFARGQLCLWAYRDGLDPATAQLTDPSISRIALANPETAPYGIAAVDYLKKAELLPAVRTKLVYGESVGQAAQFVRSGAAEVGLVALSLPLSLAAADRGRYVIIDPTKYGRVDNWAIAINRADTTINTAATEFLDYLQSPTAQTILVDYGYLINHQ